MEQKLPPLKYPHNRRTPLSHYERYPAWMSNAQKEKEGTALRSREATTFQAYRSGATMMQAPSGSGTSIPISGSASDAEERIEIAGGSGIHANDVLCGRGKVSFNHGEYRLGLVVLCFRDEITTKANLSSISFRNSRYRCFDQVGTSASVRQSRDHWTSTEVQTREVKRRR